MTYARMLLTLLVLAVVGVGASADEPHHLNLQGSELSIETLSSVAVGDHVRVEGFRTPDARLDLELDRIEVLTEDATLIVGTAEGMVELPRPQVVMLSGIVAGDADSRVFLAYSPYGTNGYIEHAGETVSVSTGPYRAGKDLRASLRSVKMDALADPNAITFGCGYTQGDAALEPLGLPEQAPPASGSRGAGTCRIASIAVESDYEFTQRLFGGDANASAAYLISLMGAISEIYQRDVDVRLVVPFLRVWADDSDPYDPNAGDPLDQVRDHWTASMGHVERTVTHFFTGRQDTSYGGLAYVGVLCSPNFGYGVSAHLTGSFPYPLQDHHSGNWDVLVAAHELGHNFGTGHTHSYSPPIDECGNGDCSDPYGGTIMSYCHGCSGGMTNIVLSFHPRVQDTIVNFMNTSSCSLISEGVTAVPDFAETLQDQSIEIDALSNDQGQSCDPFVLTDFDTSSFMGGTVELVEGAGPDGRDLLRYTPRVGYVGNDFFSYTITGDAGSVNAMVNISVLELRQADERLNPVPGLSVRYYDLSSPDMLPDFDALTPLAIDTTDHVDFPSNGGEFMGSGLEDEVGVVIEGYVWAMLDGMYTFSTESDDGSALYIGDELVVNNDGLHGMVKKGGNIPLSAGWHKIRIEFFENLGGAGLIATMSGPGMSEMPLSGLFLTHEGERCSDADFDADGELDFFDVAAFIKAYDMRDPQADLNGDGVFNYFDVAAFMTAYGAGCP